MATDVRGHTVPAGSDTFDPQGSDVALSLSTNDLIMAANAADRAAKITAISPTSGRPVLILQVDTGQVWKADGTTTVIIASPLDDTGWVNLTLASGATVSGGLTPAYRRLNGVVWLRGQATANGTGGLFTLPTIPGGLFIGQTTRFAVAAGSSGTGAGLMVVSTDGTVYTAASALVNLGASWPVG